jgi:hypothetical protein
MPPISDHHCAFLRGGQLGRHEVADGCSTQVAM